jgi:hypothetical protein
MQDTGHFIATGWHRYVTISLLSKEAEQYIGIQAVTSHSPVWVVTKEFGRNYVSIYIASLKLKNSFDYFRILFNNVT